MNDKKSIEKIKLKKITNTNLFQFFLLTNKYKNIHSKKITAIIGLVKQILFFKQH